MTKGSLSQRLLQDGKQLIEIEFPPTSLASVPGDGEECQHYAPACCFDACIRANCKQRKSAKAAEPGTATQFPPLLAPAGEGANEMTYSLQYMRQFLRALQQQAGSTRIFFPDEKEMRLAQRGLGRVSGEGWDVEPVFQQTKFQLDYLTQPTGFLDLGKQAVLI